MPYQATFIVLALAVAIIQAKELDPGPQIFTNTNSTASSQKPLKRYATKEVIVYLTPSQIKALESGKAELRTQSPEEAHIIQSSEEQKPQNLQLYNSHLENLNILKTPLVQDLLDNKQQAQYGPSFFRSSAYSANRNEFSKLPFFNPEIQQQQNIPRENVKIPSGIQSEWTPIAPVTERQAETYPVQEQYQYWANNKDTKNDQIQPEVLQTQPPLHQLQYASNYDNLYALEQGHALRQNNDLEHQRALAKVEAIDNSLPILIHKEVQITKHKPVHVVHRVNVPVPTPVLVPILHPYEVKVPQPYPVPVEVIKHIPVPVIRKEKTEVESIIPYALKKHILGNNAHIQANAEQSYLQGWKH